MRKPRHCPSAGALAALTLAVLLLAGCSYYTLQEDPRVHEQRFESARPHSMAIMPVRNDTKRKNIDNIARRGLYSALSVLDYRDRELPAVDEVVASRSLSLNLPAAQLPPDAFIDNPPADALLFARIEKASKFWFFIYSHIRLRMRLELIDGRSGRPLYENDATLHKRRISIPTSIGGVVETFYSTLVSLRESEVETAMEEFGKRVAENFPTPGHVMRDELTIDNIYVSFKDPVLRAGEQLVVELRGTPGQTARFDIGKMATGIPLKEQEAGVYVGAYTVRPRDRSQAGVVRGHLIDAEGKQVSKVMLEEGFAIDAMPPPTPVIQRVQFLSDGLALHLGLPDSQRELRFEIFRSAGGDANYRLVGRAETSVWVDRDIEPNRRYHYVVKARDGEGNVSLTGPPEDVLVPGRGPTRLEGSLLGNRSLHPFSSPYIVTGLATLPPGSTLRAEPGTVLEIGPEGLLRLEGNARFEGNENAPIRISGTGRGQLIDFRPEASTATLRLRHCRFEGAERGVVAAKGDVQVEHCEFRDFEQALWVGGVSRVGLSRSRFEDCNYALVGSANRAVVEFSHFEEIPHAISVFSPRLFVLFSDFHGRGMAIEQRAPVSTPVDNNFFDTIDEIELLRRLQGPCVFRSIYRSPSAQRRSYSPFTGSYGDYRDRGDRYYEARKYRLALQAYLHAWHLQKEKAVGLRLVELLDAGPKLAEILARDEQFTELFGKQRNTEAALLVARTLAILRPQDDAIQELYARYLDKLGYHEQARDIRRQAGANDPNYPLELLGEGIDRVRDEVEELLMP